MKLTLALLKIDIIPLKNRAKYKQVVFIICYQVDYDLSQCYFT